MAARSRCTPIMNASLQTRPRLHVRTDTCDRAVEEERATSANPSVPSSLAQLMLQRFRLVKHLHDLKRPAVVESASDNARFVECGMIYGCRRLFNQTINEEDDSTRFRRTSYELPECVEA